MSNRLTHDFVAAKFAEEGYELLSKYKNNRQKLNFVCPKGHQYFIAWECFQRGSRCALCSGQITTHEQVENAFKKEGYKLLSEYEHSHKKLKYLCAKGHSRSIFWGSFRSGNRCKICAGQIVTHEQVENAFKKEGYKLFSQYINKKTKLEAVCPNGHTYFTTWSTFKRGSRCPSCAKYGYSSSQPGRLYYLYFPGLQLYKVGVTNRLVSERFRNETNHYIILLDEYYEVGSVPLKKEKQILERFRDQKYNGPNVIRTGNSELFVSDVLGLNSYATA